MSHFDISQLLQKILWVDLMKLIFDAYALDTLTLILSRSKNYTRSNLGSTRTPIILLTSGMPYIRPNVFIK